MQKVSRDQGCWFFLINISITNELLLSDLNHETELEVELHEKQVLENRASIPYFVPLCNRCHGDS